MVKSNQTILSLISRTIIPPTKSQTESILIKFLKGNEKYLIIKFININKTFYK